MDVCPKLRPFSYKQKRPFLQLSARVKFSDCLLDWRKLEKTCKIVLHSEGNFSFCIQHTYSIPPPTEKESTFLKRTARTDIKMPTQKKKTTEPNWKLIFFCSNNPTSLATTTRSPRRESRSARDSRYHGSPPPPRGLSTLVPAPLRRTINDDDDAQRMLPEYTGTMTSAPFLEICTSVRRLDVRFVVLALARSVAFRWKTVEIVTSWHLWLENKACPLHC